MKVGPWPPENASTLFNKFPNFIGKIIILITIRALMNLRQTRFLNLLDSGNSRWRWYLLLWLLRCIPQCWLLSSMWSLPLKISISLTPTSSCKTKWRCYRCIRPTFLQIVLSHLSCYRLWFTRSLYQSYYTSWLKFIDKKDLMEHQLCSMECCYFPSTCPFYIAIP